MRSPCKYLIIEHCGGMGEWLKPTDLKSVKAATSSGVRIPLPPPYISYYSDIHSKNYSLKITSRSTYVPILEKNRALFGDEVKPFGAYLESKKNDDGIESFEWICKSLEDSTYDTVCSLANESLENWEICKELEIHKSTVSRFVQRGKGNGAIKPCNS